MPKRTLVMTVLVAACMCNSAFSAQDDRGNAGAASGPYKPAAFRLCGGCIPDHAEVESCLRQIKQDPSDRCRPGF
jgi:hypothetical protein